MYCQFSKHYTCLSSASVSSLFFFARVQSLNKEMINGYQARVSFRWSFSCKFDQLGIKLMSFLQEQAMTTFLKLNDA